MGLVLPNLRDNSAFTPSACSLNEDTTVLLVLDRVEKTDICLVAGVAPCVLADGVLVDPVSSEEVPRNSHVAPNA